MSNQPQIDMSRTMGRTSGLVEEGRLQVSLQQARKFDQIRRKSQLVRQGCNRISSWSAMMAQGIFESLAERINSGHAAAQEK